MVRNWRILVAEMRIGCAGAKPSLENLSSSGGAARRLETWFSL